MDKVTLKNIKENLKIDIKQRGFKTEGQWYIRVVNAQILQYIFFQGSSSGDTFYVNIGIIPLCIDNVTSAKYYLGSERLCETSGNGEWNYSNKSVETVTGLIKEVVFPLFDTCTTYRELFETIKPVIENISFYLQNPCDMVGRIYFALYYQNWTMMFVKLQEYEYGIKYLRNVYFLEEKYYNETRNSLEEDVSKLADSTEPMDLLIRQNCIDVLNGLKETAVDRITPIKNLIEQLENNDIHEMMERIEKNEKINNESLKKYAKKEKKS